MHLECGYQASTGRFHDKDLHTAGENADGCFAKRRSWLSFVGPENGGKLGYNVHITRASDWTDSESNSIRIDEWLAYIGSDPEMRLDNFADAQTPAGSVIRYENAGVAVWVAWSRTGVDGNQAWFDYRQGRIVVKNPDDAILGKMCIIAEN